MAREIPLEKRQAASRALALQRGAAGSGEYKRAYRSAMRTFQRQQAPEGKQQRGQKRGPSQKYRAVRAVAEREPTKPRRGKYKAEKADRRFTRNTAETVIGKNKPEKNQVQMWATYNFYANDSRRRAVIFDLDDEEQEQLNELLEEYEGDELVQEVGEFLVNTKGAGYMNRAKVQGIKEIKII